MSIASWTVTCKDIAAFCSLLHGFTGSVAIRYSFDAAALCPLAVAQAGIGRSRSRERAASHFWHHVLSVLHTVVTTRTILKTRATQLQVRLRSVRYPLHNVASRQCYINLCKGDTCLGNEHQVGSIEIWRVQQRAVQGTVKQPDSS